MSVAGEVAFSTCLWVPVFVAASAASVSRPFARLSGPARRAGFAAAGAAALAALSAAAQLAFLPRQWFLVLGPPWIGAAPWVGGEMVSGPSRRQDESFAAALVAAYGGGLLATCARADLLGQTVATAAAATFAYLCVRGGPRSAGGEEDARR